MSRVMKSFVKQNTRSLYHLEYVYFVYLLSNIHIHDHTVVIESHVAFGKKFPGEKKNCEMVHCHDA
jgi:hypothetical protein